MTRTGVARQPFCVWILDNIGSIGVKRLASRIQKRDSQGRGGYCRKVFEEQVPFDYELSDDDTALYCVEMTEKAFRSAGIELSKPIRLGDMERASEFPLQMFGIRFASKYALEHPLTFDQLVYFPGNENHGIWSARQLMTVVPPTFAPDIPTIRRCRPQLGQPARTGSSPSAKKVSSPGHATAAAVRRSPARTTRETSGIIDVDEHRTPPAADSNRSRRNGWFWEFSRMMPNPRRWCAGRPWNRSSRV